MLDVSRAKERFGFVATTKLEEGIRATVAWYRARLADPGAHAEA
jgi:nucleoside-diphosphate-sugar epimerase